jgi:hypothetical protein
MTITAIAVLATATIADAEPRIIGASLFKNGYSLVTREFPLSGAETSLVAIPQAALGTFWIVPTGNIRVKEIVATSREKTVEGSVTTIQDFLRLNVGKNVTVQAGGRTVTGTLTSISGELVLIASGGSTTAFHLNLVTSASVEGEIVTKQKHTISERILRFKTDGTGTIQLFGLERGMTWAPGYAIELLDDKNLQLTAKSTVLNDLGRLDNVELKFVTGFPNVPWATTQEPLLSGQSVDQFTAFLSAIGSTPPSGFAGRREIMTQNAGLGGGGGGPLPMLDTGGAGGVQMEDLFFYRQPGVTLKPGDRAYYTLFQAKSEYEDIYTLDLPDTLIDANNYYRPGAGEPAIYDVWHTLQFKNTSGQPLTTAPATVFKNGQILGQDTVLYSSPGAKVEVKMTKALDIRPDVAEEEVDRQRAALDIPSYGRFDLVTVRGTILLENRKAEAAKLRISKWITGEFVSGDGAPKVTKVAKGLRDVNAKSRLDWTPTLAKGQSVTLTYTYRVYVRI